MEASSQGGDTRGAAHGKIRSLCAVCCAPRSTTPHLMTHGVVVHLCRAHGELSYLRRDGGRTFVQRLMELWSAHNALTCKRRSALRAHLTRVRATGTNDLPGSYGWKAQRAHAEARFAKGDRPSDVIDDVRDPARFPGCPPSIRTVRRWLADGRWLTPPVPTSPPAHGVVDAIRAVLRVLDALDREASRFWHTQDRASVENRRAVARLRAP